jgi:hypothetical protein
MDGGDPQWEKKYPAFVVNKCLSGHIDTVMFANEMNLNHQLTSRLQYDFLLNSVRKRKRFSPWLKKEKIQDLDAVKSYYGYSNEKAQQALKILTKDQINYIKSKLDVGGKR